MTYLVESTDTSVLYGTDIKVANINYEKMIPYIIAYIQNFVVNLENAINNSDSFNDLSTRLWTCVENVSTLFDLANTTDSSIKLINSSVNKLEALTERIDASLAVIWSMLDDIVFHTDTSTVTKK